MQGNRVTYTFYVPGTLGADPAIKFNMPFAALLVEVSAATGGAAEMAITVGSDSAVDAYLTEYDTGVSSTPVRKVASDFVGGVAPLVPKGGQVAIAGNYDSSGGACANFTIMLTFEE